MRSNNVDNGNSCTSWQQCFKIDGGNGIFILTLLSGIIGQILFSILSFGCQNFQVILDNDSSNITDNDEYKYRYGFWAEYSNDGNTCIEYTDIETNNNNNNKVLILGRVFGAIGFVLGLLYLGYLCNEDYFHCCQHISKKDRIFAALIPVTLILISASLCTISRKTSICQYSNNRSCSFTRRGYSGFAAVVFWCFTTVGEFYLGWKQSRIISQTAARAFYSSSTTRQRIQLSNSRIHPHHNNIAHALRPRTANPNIPGIDDNDDDDDSKSNKSDNNVDDDRYADEEGGNHVGSSIESNSIPPPQNPDYYSVQQSIPSNDGLNRRPANNTNERQDTENVNVATTISEKTGILNEGKKDDALVTETIHFPDGTTKQITTRTTKQDDGSPLIERTVLVRKDKDVMSNEVETIIQPNYWTIGPSDIEHDYSVAAIPPNNQNSTIVETFILPDGSQRKTTTKTTIDDDGNLLVDRTVVFS